MKDVLIIHENHSSFDCDILQRVFGKYYNIESIILNATDRGVPQSRERRWTLMSNKEYVTQTFSTLCRVMPFYTYDVKYSWHCCMVAGNDELQTELEWACNPKRASSLWPSGKNVQLEPGAFKMSLSKCELEFLTGYERVRPAGCCHMLSQNPTKHVQSSTPRILGTIIKNSSITWSSSHGRWLAPSELLCGQGFPGPEVVELLDEGEDGISRIGSEFSNFFRKRDSRKANSVKSQAGNSMPVPICGLFWHFCLGYLRHFGVEPVHGIPDLPECPDNPWTSQVLGVHGAEDSDLDSSDSD